MRKGTLETSDAWPHRAALIVYVSEDGERCVGAAALAQALNCRVSRFPADTVKRKPAWLTDGRVDHVVFLNDDAIQCVKSVIDDKNAFNAIVKQIRDEEEDEVEELTTPKKREYVGESLESIFERKLLEHERRLFQKLNGLLDHNNIAAAKYAYMQSGDWQKEREALTHHLRETLTRQATERYEADYRKMMEERRPEMEKQVESDLRIQLIKEKLPAVRREVVQEQMQAEVAKVAETAGKEPLHIPIDFATVSKKQKK